MASVAKSIAWSLRSYLDGATVAPVYLRRDLKRMQGDPASVVIITNVDDEEISAASETIVFRKYRVALAAYFDSTPNFQAANASDIDDATLAAQELRQSIDDWALNITGLPANTITWDVTVDGPVVDEISSPGAASSTIYFVISVNTSEARN